ncbi:uncharacterized protein LOC130392418 [Gadus chalcogrammus]|uniref:uncharacterized protein LOC130392418 n=1 Tax=Gadus chalcogrammus TaxID=1042646 RepID=UPI0024C4DAC7|nr:uncharacterized protein LOC130392418 [Gadus chalcogrammus]
MSALDAFWEAPLESLLLTLTVQQLIEVAERYSIEITLPKTARKDCLVDLICESLKVKDVLPFFCYPIVDPVMEQSPGQKSESAMAYSVLTFKEQKVILQMQLEQKRFDAVEREQERLLEQDRLQLERLRLDLMAEAKYGNSKQPSNLASMVKFLPKFNERDPDVSFSLFESVASDLEWTGEDQVLLLQTALYGKSQEAYVALSATDLKSYKTVEEAVLKAYKLVPEAYRQRFWNHEKSEKQTYTEAAREQSSLFHRWLAAEAVDDFDLLCNLMIVEQFKNILPERVATYVNEHRVKTVSEASSLAVGYVLTHKSYLREFSPRKDYYR